MEQSIGREAIVPNLLARLEEQKTEWLTQLEGWPSDQLQYRPTAAEWSALEVLDHLVKTEVAILLAASAGLAQPHRIYLTDQWRTAFLQKVFASDRKVKVPDSARQVLPSSNLELTVISERWQESRAKLHRFAQESHFLKQSQLGIFKHPVGGWMGLEQILAFFSVHLIHHRHQLNRIIQSATPKQT